MSSDLETRLVQIDERLRALEPCHVPQRGGSFLPAPHDFEGDGTCAVCKVPRSHWHPVPGPLFSPEDVARLKDSLTALERSHAPVRVEVANQPAPVAGAISLGKPEEALPRTAGGFLGFSPDAVDPVAPLAQLFYEVYCDHAEWKNYQGLPCPRWDERATRGSPEAVLTDAVRGHWHAVAAFALGVYGPRLAGAQAASR